MLGLLADVHSEGHLEVLLRICRSPQWREVWVALKVRVCAFDTFGFDRRMKDSDLWEFCQRQDLLLVTNNRNQEDADSLQATIASRNSLASLPVLTLADADLILNDRSYAERAAIRLMEILLDVDAERGTGRLFLPSTPESEGAQ